MKDQTTTNRQNVFSRVIKGIKNGWQSYSKAIDIAYSRGMIHHHPELCTGNNQNIAPKTNSRAFKASAFDDYNTYQSFHSQLSHTLGLGQPGKACIICYGILNRQTTLIEFVLFHAITIYFIKKINCNGMILSQLLYSIILVKVGCLKIL